MAAGRDQRQRASAELSQSTDHQVPSKWKVLVEVRPTHSLLAARVNDFETAKRPREL